MAASLPDAASGIRAQLWPLGFGWVGISLLICVFLSPLSPKSKQSWVTYQQVSIGRRALLLPP